MTNYDFLTSLSVEKAEAPEPKERTMPSGPKAMQLPDSITEKINSGEWFSAGNLPDGKSASAFLYAVRVAAKKYVTAEAPDGHGLQVVVDQPANSLLKDLRELEGPITLRISAANPLDTRRGRGAKKATDPADADTWDSAAKKGDELEALFPTEPVATQPLTMAEQELLDDLGPAETKVTSPGAFVDPDAEPDFRD